MQGKPYVLVQSTKSFSSSSVLYTSNVCSNFFHVGNPSLALCGNPTSKEEAHGSCVSFERLLAVVSGGVFFSSACEPLDQH